MSQKVTTLRLKLGYLDSDPGFPKKGFWGKLLKTIQGSQFAYHEMILVQGTFHRFGIPYKCILASFLRQNKTVYTCVLQWYKILIGNNLFYLAVSLMDRHYVTLLNGSVHLFSIYTGAITTKDSTCLHKVVMRTKRFNKYSVFRIESGL